MLPSLFLCGYGCLTSKLFYFDGELASFFGEFSAIVLSLFFETANFCVLIIIRYQAVYSYIFIIKIDSILIQNTTNKTVDNEDCEEKYEKYTFFSTI